LRDINTYGFRRRSTTAVQILRLERKEVIRLKKTYQRPALTRHGSVEQVTLNMLGFMGDSGAMFFMMMGAMMTGS
jgi:hypothetical protein